MAKGIIALVKVFIMGSFHCSSIKERWQNLFVKLDIYPLPKIDELFNALAGGQMFSKLDLAHAHLQLPLAKSSKHITTINTHKGLFQYNRMPFGISSAPAILQRTIETLLNY